MTENSTKDNFKQELFEFAKRQYRTKFKVFYKQFWTEFPYKFKNLSEELDFKNWVDWLMIEKVLPETGKTIVEEYVEMHPELAEDFKQCLLRMKNVVRGKFIVLSVNGLKLNVKCINVKDEYPVKLYNKHNLHPGDIIEGRIHQFDDYYRICGAFLIIDSDSHFFPDPKLFMRQWERNYIKEIEEKIINPESSIISLLKNYPFQWIDGICSVLNIQEKLKKDKINAITACLHKKLSFILSELSNSSKQALWLVLQEEGRVKYHTLRDFSNEMSFWWNDGKTPTSAIGALRMRALLFVGNSYIGNKKYKTALIPTEIRDALFKILSQEFRKEDKTTQQKLI